MQTFNCDNVFGINKKIIGVVTTSKLPWWRKKENTILVSTKIKANYTGYALVISNKFIDVRGPIAICKESNIYAELHDGDVVSIDLDGVIRLENQVNSMHNYLFVTNICNCKCLTCPNSDTDRQIISNVPDAIKIIKLMDTKFAKLLSITGGEPTAIGSELVDVLQLCKLRLQNTLILLLSNGINFKNFEYAKAVSIAADNLLVDIALYSDVAHMHNELVGVNGFYSSIKGIYNLHNCGVHVGIRIVINKINHNRLLKIAHYIYRNMPFVHHVAFMQMEPHGNALKNIDQLWIDPYEYRELLAEAVEFLSNVGITVEIYNFQLCLLPDNVKKFAEQSISNWKRIFLDVCSECSKKSGCSGFFASQSDCHSKYINPLPN